MPVDHRKLILVIAVAATLVGVAAGMNIARLQSTATTRTIVPSPESTPGIARISKDFFRPTASTTPAVPEQKTAGTAGSTGSPALARTVPPDGITADAYIVGNLDTGEVYLSRNADAILPFASMSKLITALVATNLYSLDDVITLASTSDISPDLSGIHDGETFTVRELLDVLLLSSSNRAAEAFATHASSTPRAEFLKLMNGYSWEIGMPHAFFADASGLDRLNAGTARGFLAMAQYLYRSRADILAVTHKPSASLSTTTAHDAHPVINIHPYAADPRFLGGKTGHTYAALDTMLTILRLRDAAVAFIVLRSDNRAKDTALLIDKLRASVTQK